MQTTPQATVVFQLAREARKPIEWASAWPDALALGVGLAVARWAGWTAGDLIWSLWLSSLVVGYATIVWLIGHPAVVLSVLTWRSRNQIGKLYLEILRRYWVFLPSAFLSHRAVFMAAPLTLDGKRWAESFVRNGKKSKEFFLAPYVNVIRLHVLIFFFGFAHFAGLENFVVYAVIYMAYFFPWRLVRRDTALGVGFLGVYFR